MIYFDHAATSFPKPQAVKDAVIRAMDTFGNPARGAHEFALEALRRVEYTRTQAAELFGCPRSERVVFTKNVTEALNIAIASVGGHVVTTAAEHNSVLRPVFRQNHTVVPVDGRGRYTVDDLARALRPETRAVVLGQASNLTGRLQPIAEAGRLCRERGLIFIVDAAQTAGLLDIDMEALGIDALCFTGHKSLYGLQGTGGMCLSQRFTPDPLMVGGSGLHSFGPEHPAELPARLEAGTLNGHGLASLSAGLEYVAGQGPSRLLAEADRVAGHFYRGVRDIEGVTVYGDREAERTLPIVALNVGNHLSSDAAAALAEEYGLAVRAGAHCAPLLHRALGTAERGAVRFSFSHCNTLEEAALAVEAIRDLSRRETL